MIEKNYNFKRAFLIKSLKSSFEFGAEECW